MTNMPGGLIEVKVVPGRLPQNWRRIKGIGDVLCEIPFSAPYPVTNFRF
jgi:hypothetical protein